MKFNRLRRAGFTLVEIMIVVAIIGLLAAIAIPNFVRARTTAQTKACINNLVQIYSAKVRWALDNKKLITDIPTDTDLIGPDLYLRKKPVCPIGGKYDYGQIDQPPSCDKPGHSVP